MHVLLWLPFRLWVFRGVHLSSKVWKAKFLEKPSSLHESVEFNIKFVFHEEKQSFDVPNHNHSLFPQQWQQAIFEWLDEFPSDLMPKR